MIVVVLLLYVLGVVARWFMAIQRFDTTQFDDRLAMALYYVIQACVALCWPVLAVDWCINRFVFSHKKSEVIE